MSNIVFEPISDRNRFAADCDYKNTTLDKAIKAALAKVDYGLECFGEGFPWGSSENNVYRRVENDCGWHTGFWTGILWLSYELTGDEKYRRAAETHVPTFLTRIEQEIVTCHHDMGFLYTPSCVAAYKLTANQIAKKAALLAADNLLSRYHEKGEFIQAWGPVNHPDFNRMIIDCLLNLPLLYWATEVTGDAKYEDAARRHYRSTVSNIVREDASTYHTFYFDYETGKPSCGKTAQGYSDDSSWARGQAWGVYGTMLDRVYNGDKHSVELCKKLLNYFLNRLPEDMVPHWDLVFTSGDEPRDSSAAAIAVCGIMELVKFLPDSDADKKLYENAALHMMQSLYDNYRSEPVPECNGLLLHAVQNKKSGAGVDECNLWGDYFYMESLVRMKTDNKWKLYW